MHSKRTALIALAMLVLLMPLATSIAFADSSTHPTTNQQPVSLTLQGMVMDAGSQTYQLSGGQLVGGSVFGLTITSGFLYYQMDASVLGLSTYGTSFLVLSAQTSNGSLWLEASGHISDSMAAAQFPFGCGSQGPSCTSEIPGMFLGLDRVSYSIGGVQRAQVTLPIGIESTYLNPFGGPIVLTSLDSTTNPAIAIIATYSSATIEWSNVLMAGTATGLFGASQANGVFSMRVASFENLVTGVEYDQGQIVLNDVTPNGILAVGEFHGVSTIPTTGGQVCPATLGFPDMACTETGLTSTGNMNLWSSNIHIVGAYETLWGTPALGFISSVSGKMTSVNSHN
jgi:hypothetical protein